MDFENLRRLFDSRTARNCVLGQIDNTLAEAINATTSDVFLSRHTVDKQLLRHPEVDMEHYQIIQPSLTFGECWLIEPKKVAIILVDTVLYNTNFRSIIKSTDCGTELYLISFHRMRNARLARYRRSLERKGILLLREHSELEKGPKPL